MKERILKILKSPQQLMQVLLVLLIAFPPITLISYTLNRSAQLSSVGLNGEVKRLRITDVPVVSAAQVKRFFSDGIVTTLSSHWLNVEEKYTSNHNYYFSSDAWEALKQNQVEQGIVGYMFDNRIVRYVVDYEDPVVISARVIDGDVLFLVQGKFIRTFRGRSSQKSSKFYISGTIKASKYPENGSALKIIDFKETPA